MVDAVVVGAGLAGLSAADELQRAGCEVVVLEVRDRVGGRVWSRQLPNGAVVEMGAEFILPGNDAVLELADRLGLGLWDKGMRYGRREARGGIGTSAEAVDRAVVAIEAALADLGPEPRSALSLLEALEIEPGAREAIVARVEVSSASPADRVPATDLAGLAHIDDSPAPSVAGGNQGLATGLAAELGDRVHLGSPVEAIAWSEEGVRVATAGGELTAQGCVVAVPAGVIDRIRFEPELPDPLRSALEAVVYGHAAKLFVPLRREAPPSAVISVPERYWCWTATGAGDRPQPVVNAFSGSAPALAALEVERGPERWLRSLRDLRPDLELEPSAALLSRWSDDPWAGGAYSVSPDRSLNEALSVPLGAGALAFAGEHTAGPFNGLMEGAIRSGRRAAERLLAARSS